MADVISLRDQTISEAARRRIPRERLVNLVELLRKMSFDCYDIGLEDWLYYGHLGLPKGLPEGRCRVEPYLEQVKAANNAGFKKVAVVYEHQSSGVLDEKLSDALKAADSLRLETSLEIRNASSLSLQGLLDIFTSFADFGVQSFIYCDMDSKLDPFITNAVFDKLLQSTDLALEFHANNHYGLATANCLAAIQAGVKIVHVSVGGIGSSGHAAYEEVVMNMRRVDHASYERIPKLAEICHAILECIGIKKPLTKAIIGSDIFAHESGIHAAGILKRPELYEAFSPEEVGLSRRLVIGKHSGRTSLGEKLKHENIILNATQAELLLAKVRQMAVDQKLPLTDEQLKKLYHDCIAQ